jgi:hypothetical protein
MTAEEIAATRERFEKANDLASYAVFHDRDLPAIREMIAPLDDVPRLIATIEAERARADAAEAKLARIAALPIMGAQLTLHDLENGLWPRVVRLDDINAVLAEGKA